MEGNRFIYAALCSTECVDAWKDERRRRRLTSCCLPLLQIAAGSVCAMRLVWKSLDKMRCLRKRSTIPFLGFLITFLLFLNLYIEDGYVLVSNCAVLDKCDQICFWNQIWSCNSSLYPCCPFYNCLFSKENSLNFHNMDPRWRFPDVLLLIHDAIQTWWSQYIIHVCCLNY